MEHQIEHRMEVPSRWGVSRIEVLDGPTGRRRWPDEVNERSNAIGRKRCVSPVVSTWGDFGHAALQLSLQEFGDGAPK